MSGGHFDYEQHRIEDIASSVEEAIGKPEVYGFSAATLDEFRHGVAILRRAAIYAQRIDWLLSGDDGEESFHRRLAEDLAEQTPRVFDEAAYAELVRKGSKAWAGVDVEKFMDEVRGRE